MNRWTMAAAGVFAASGLAWGGIAWGAAAFGDDEKPGTLVILNKGAANASLLDRESGAEVSRLPVGTGPHEAAVSPDGAIAVACNYGQQQAGNSLTVLDLEKQRVVRTIDLGEYTRPHGVVFTPDGKRVVVTSESTRTIVVVNLGTGEVEKAIGTEANASHMVAITPDGSRAFVANIASGSVTAIDLGAGEILKQIVTGAGAEGVDVSPDGKHVWVTNRQAYTVSVVDAKTLEVIESVPCGEFPIRVKVTPDGKHALVSCAASGDVAVLDTATRKEIARVSMKVEAGEGEGRLFGDQFGGSPVPIGILIPPDGKHAYIANAQADVIAEIDLGEWKVTRYLRAGREPDGMAWSAVEIEVGDAPAAEPVDGSSGVVEMRR